MLDTASSPGALRAAYEENGWFTAPTRLDAESVEKLRASVAEISRQDRPEVVHEKGSDAVRAIHGCHDFDDVCGRLVRLPALLGLAEHLLGEPVYVYQFKVNMKQPREGAAWPWHQDYAFWSREDGMPEDRAVNIAVLLDDTHEGNGPLRVVPGSHRSGLLDAGQGADGRSHDWRNHVAADLEYTVPDTVAEELAARSGTELATGPAGTICVFHPSIVHSSSSNTSADRRAMLLVTYNAVSNAALHCKRPEFLVTRDAVALTPLADAVL
ncbi:MULTISPECIES: phytanoyl-CoA dioxygenase family protein [unclassified Streptomyces]|uniref:phytanoyl-CoA dioxygenase family protein n=1 Tax=unclassified Streptomyces TaxID=2593676 RepID=UPI0036E252DE